MKRDLILLVVVAALFAVSLVLLSWGLGSQYGRLACAQESTATRVLNIEHRVLPVEQDYIRRKAVRSAVSRAWGWLCKKLKF